MNTRYVLFLALSICYSKFSLISASKFAAPSEIDNVRGKDLKQISDLLDALAVVLERNVLAKTGHSESRIAENSDLANYLDSVRDTKHVCDLISQTSAVMTRDLNVDGDDGEGFDVDEIIVESKAMEEASVNGKRDFIECETKVLSSSDSMTAKAPRKTVFSSPNPIPESLTKIPSSAGFATDVHSQEEIVSRLTQISQPVGNVVNVGSSYAKFLTGASHSGATGFNPHSHSQQDTVHSHQPYVAPAGVINQQHLLDSSVKPVITLSQSTSAAVNIQAPVQLKTMELTAEDRKFDDLKNLMDRDEDAFCSEIGAILEDDVSILQKVRNASRLMTVALIKYKFKAVEILLEWGDAIDASSLKRLFAKKDCVEFANRLRAGTTANGEPLLRWDSAVEALAANYPHTKQAFGL